MSDVPLPEDLFRPAEKADNDAAGWKPIGKAQSAMDELTDDLNRSHGTLSDDEAMWELLRMGADGSWKQTNGEEAQEDGNTQTQQPAPEPESQSPETGTQPGPKADTEQGAEFKQPAKPAVPADKHGKRQRARQRGGFFGNNYRKPKH